MGREQSVQIYLVTIEMQSQNHNWAKSFLKEESLKPIHILSVAPSYVWLCALQIKEIQKILRLFLVIAMCCQASSSQLKSITQPLRLLAGWEGILGTCSR